MGTSNPLRPERIADETIEEVIPSGISSLRDIQVLYGVLSSLAERGTVAGAGVTPDEGDDYLGHDSILTIDIDLQGSEPSLADPPVSVHHYSTGMKPLLAHARYSEGRNAVDHSITHQAGKNPDTVAKWTAKRLNTWPFEEGISELAETTDNGQPIDEDGWIIGALQALGEATDENENEDGDSPAVARVKAAVDPNDLDTRGAMVTVRLRLSDEDLMSLDKTGLFVADSDGGWHWPGEFEIFARAMEARREDKLSSKGGGDASGRGSCFVFDGDPDTDDGWHDLYGSFSDPIGDAGIWQTNTVEKFPNLDVDEAWRSFGLSFHAASMVTESDELVEACRYRNWRGKSKNEYRFWMLPYLEGELDANDARLLYGILEAQADDAARYDELRDLAFDEDTDVSWGDLDPVTPVDRMWERVIDDAGLIDDDLTERLRLYLLATRVVDNGNLNVVLDEPAGTVPNAVALATVHTTILDEIARFGTRQETEVDGWEPFPLLPYGELLDPPTFERNRIHLTATPRYFFRTCVDLADEVSDDWRYKATANVLGGQPINSTTLFELYAARIREEFDPESKYPMPEEVITEQFVQLCALAGAGLLRGDDALERIDQTFTDTIMTHESDPEVETDWYRSDEPGDRERAIDAFLDSSPPLNPETTSGEQGTQLAHERRVMFLLGTLVARVSSYQAGAEGLGKTLAHSVEKRGISRRHVNKIINDVYHYNSVYSAKENQPLFWKDLFGRLTAAYSQVGDPNEWSLATDEIETWYAFGHVFGSNLPKNDDDDPELEETELTEAN